MSWWSKKTIPAPSPVPSPDAGCSHSLIRADTYNHVRQFDLRIKGVVFVDWITEFEPCYLYPGDSLTIRWSVMIAAYVNNRLTDTQPFIAEATFTCQKPQIMRYARFTMAGGKSEVAAYEELPVKNS